MLALQLQDSGSMMGLAYDGTFQAAVTETVAERLARIRSKLLMVGIPAAVIGGGVTTLVFAGAFGLARSERVWAPSLWLGGVSALGGLLSVAIAAKTVKDTAVETEMQPITVTAPTAAAAAATAPATHATLGRYRYY